MTSPIALVPKTKASDEVRESVVELLRKSLAEAAAGDITSAIVILRHADGEWTDRCSDTVTFSEDIGRLEITKQRWIAQYLKYQTSQLHCSRS